jgi:DNA polymerase-3 subunit delta
MSLSSEQFLKGLKKAQIKPVYIIAGQESLLIQECGDALKSHLKSQGFSERIVIETDNNGFSWDELYHHSHAMSLFATQRIIDLRLPTGKPGKEGAAALIDYCKNPAPDTVLIITCQEWSTKHGGKWSEAIEKVGQLVVAWPIKPNEMAYWLQHRLIAKGISASDEAIQILLTRVEGNLLAANQEINKLAMQGLTGDISAEQMQQWVADSSRYDVFKLIDACYAKDIPRMSKILHGLKSEGDMVPGLLPMIAKELMNLAYYASIQQTSRRAQAQMQADRQWQSKQVQMLRMIDAADVMHFEALLSELAVADKMSKGRATGDEWVALERVLCQWAMPKTTEHLVACN